MWNTPFQTKKHRTQPRLTLGAGDGGGENSLGWICGAFRQTRERPGKGLGREGGRGPGAQGSSPLAGAPLPLPALQWPLDPSPASQLR